MSTHLTLDPRRAILCSRINAERLAGLMCEMTAIPHAVVRTTCPLQPYRVVRVTEARKDDAVEHAVVAL